MPAADPWPAAEASSGNLLEMQIRGSHPRPIESESLELGPSTLSFKKPSRWFWSMLTFKNSCPWDCKVSVRAWLADTVIEQSHPLFLDCRPPSTLLYNREINSYLRLFIIFVSFSCQLNQSLTILSSYFYMILSFPCIREDFLLGYTIYL